MWKTNKNSSVSGTPTTGHLASEAFTSVLVNTQSVNQTDSRLGFKMVYECTR